MRKLLVLILLCATLICAASCSKEPEEKDDNFVLVTYAVDGGGMIYTNDTQLIEKGASTESVTAVANDGWVFIGWDDGNENPTRMDKSITEDTVFTAIFVTDEGFETDDDTDEGDAPNDAPLNPSDEQDQQENQDQEENQAKIPDPCREPKCGISPHISCRP